MPNRILRDCTDSIPVNSVSVHAERLFYRLIMKVDDFGRLVANPKLLRPLLFPLLLDEVREADLQRWIAECVKAGLVRLYEVNEKQYLEIQNFKQRTRAKHSKFPTPSGEGPAHDGHMTVTSPPHDGHMLTETETETETFDDARASPEADPLGKRIRAFFRDHPSLIWTHDAETKARRMAELRGWDAMTRAIEEAVKRSASSPVDYALKVFDSDGLKERARTAPRTVAPIKPVKGFRG